MSVLQAQNRALAERIVALEREAGDLTRLVDTMRIATVFVDVRPAGRPVPTVARFLFDLLDIAVEQTLDRMMSQLDYPELQADVRAALKTAAQVEREIVDGVTGRQFVARITPRHDGDGQVEGTVLTLTELDAADMAEQSLEESEQRYRAFVTASSDAVYRMSPDWTEMRRLDGRNFLPDVLAPSEDWMDTYIDPAEHDRVRASIDRAIRSRNMFELEHRVIRADGTLGWTHSRAVPIIGRDGNITEWIGTASDMTEVRAAESNRRASEERLRAAIEVARVGTWDWNVATGELSWSDEHYRMHGYAVGEVVPSYEVWQEHIHPDDRAPTERALNRCRETGEEYVHEYRAVHGDGSIHCFSARGRFVFDDRGEAIRMFGAMMEVTAERELEKRQNVLVGELQHRTRNLLGVVRSIADKTMRGTTDLCEFQKGFGMRLDALARVQGLLSRVDERRRVTFDELLRVELAAHGVADDDRGRVSLSGPADIPLRSGMVQMLAMALHELATNAAKYGALKGPDGRLTIRWRTLVTPDAPTRLEIVWEEHGVTMPPPGASTGRTGQGRELIERALPYQLDAETRYELGSDGVLCSMIIPISGVLHD